MPPPGLFSASFVIGGTGMLAAASHWLIGRSRHTIVVARHATRFAAGLSSAVPIDADWRSGLFKRAVVAALKEAPSLQRALLWLHEPAPLLG